MNTLGRVSPLPTFAVELDGRGMFSRVLMDGVDLRGVKAVTVKAELDAIPEVTITFLAASVNKPDAESGS